MAYSFRRSKFEVTCKSFSHHLFKISAKKLLKQNGAAITIRTMSFHARIEYSCMFLPSQTFPLLPKTSFSSLKRAQSPPIWMLFLRVIGRTSKKKGSHFRQEWFSEVFYVRFSAWNVTSVILEFLKCSTFVQIS